MAVAALLAAGALTACGPSTPSRDETGGRQPSPAGAAKTEPPKVTHFYAIPGWVARGEEVTVCYGVENAESVRLDPRIRDLTPSINRCFSFSPEKSGSYRLIATGADGREDSADLAIKVDPAARPKPEPEASMITLFMANRTVVPQGSMVTLCYSVEGAESVEIDPPVQDLTPEQTCFTARVEETTTFRLTARGGGRTEEKELTVEAR